MLNPNVGSIVLISSPLNFFKIVVFPALSSPLWHVVKVTIEYFVLSNQLISLQFRPFQWFNFQKHDFENANWHYIQKDTASEFSLPSPFASSSLKQLKAPYFLPINQRTNCSFYSPVAIFFVKQHYTTSISLFLLPLTTNNKGAVIKMAAVGRTRVRLSEASQFFHNDDTDTQGESGEYSAEDSTSEKVSYSF